MDLNGAEVRVSYTDINLILDVRVICLGRTATKNMNDLKRDVQSDYDKERMDGIGFG